MKKNKNIMNTSAIETYQEAIEQWGEAFEIFLNSASTLDEAIDYFEDSYQGEYNSLYDFAVQLFDELYLHELPDYLAGYIDYDAPKRDLEYEGYWIERSHVFGPY